ncbi:hypothetical protein GIB67_034728 [Kingdonia uniflora]|uniref:Uncharacterized protein n=1 Tax=Kingdonia uniflora TaxID=39325 RepID=A0A7J7ML71_9MAGN|nr:hypothetical protein GIB67_034728 [Kingdonia uniflora]
MWSTRNKCTYEDKEVNLSECKGLILSFIKDCSQLSKSCMNSPFDLMIVSNLGVSSHLRRAPRIRSCRWILPWYEEVKISCDGSSMGNPGMGGVGVVFRNHEGEVIGVFVHNLDIVPSFFAECFAIIDGLSKAKEKRWNRVWVVSDSNAAILAIQSNKIPWRLQPKWNETLDGYRKWLLQHCCEGIFHIVKGNSSQAGSSEKIPEKNRPVTPLVVTHGSGGSRTGLFRTPISGGVQSATSAHGLPRPALAVRNLMEQARFAHLCTVMSRMHHRRVGYPFGSLVDFAPDSMGHPIFSFSPLAIHTRNLLADPRCTLVVQIPGWSGLSNARVTIFGDVFPLPQDQQEWAHKQYVAKHHQGASQQWGNFYYFRMDNISDIYFIGGFGTVAWVDIKEYETLQPDKIAINGGEQNLKELNAIFSKPLKELLSTEIEIDDAALISIDSKGVDIRVRQGAQFNIQRISFEVGNPVETLEEAKASLQKLINKDCRLRL